MNTPGISNIRTIAGRVMIVLALTAMIGSICPAPASAKGDKDTYEKHDNGRYEKKGRGNYDRGRRVYRRDVYRERVYVEPPVIYAPPPPPGISIFFPPIVFRP